MSKKPLTVKIKRVGSLLSVVKEADITEQEGRQVVALLEGDLRSAVSRVLGEYDADINLSNAVLEAIDNAGATVSV